MGVAHALPERENMTDDWKRRDDTGNRDAEGYGTDFGDDFGTVQFGDDAVEPVLSFGDDTGPLPHWTEPPTGEIPKFLQSEPADDADVWSTFSQPAVQPNASPEPAYRDEPTREARYFENDATPGPGARREPRLVIGSDPTDDRASRPEMHQPTGCNSRPVARQAPVGRGARPSSQRPMPQRSQRSTGGIGGRDMPQAVTAGLLLAAAFIGALLLSPAVVMVLVLAVIGLAAFEFFTQITQAGYRPISLIGIVGCVAAPAVAYWKGDSAIPLVLMFAFVATSLVFVSGDSVDSGPVPNSAATMIALMWIGLMGSYAGLILRWSTLGDAFQHRGTDTLFIIVAGVVANDIAAYFVGTAIGRQPLREWISPKKSVEGVIGGTIGTFVIVVLVGMQSTTWNSFGSWILLALVISVMAPLGDLTESMFKRNLDIKDFGTLLSGHGGALDRFDSMLFVLPAVYYLGMVITPWA